MLTKVDSPHAYIENILESYRYIATSSSSLGLDEAELEQKSA